MNNYNNYCYSQTNQWSEIIRDTYDHSVYRITAENNYDIGTLDFVHINNLIFGNTLISMPFCDVGGFKGNSVEIEHELLRKAIVIASDLRIPVIELRTDNALPWLTSDFFCRSSLIKNGNDFPRIFIKTHKVRMVLDLPKSPDILMDGFKSKLRSQIRKPVKEGLYTKIGKRELLDDFYKVFASNMRDLGSPVHSKKLFEQVLNHFQDRADLILVYKMNIPVAGAMVVGNGKILSNPWASSLKEYRSYSPNMLLYWEMLKYAIERGYRQFDFGRSTPGEGTHAFKVQWGAKEEPLYWYRIFLKGKPSAESADDQSAFNVMVKIWQKLPVGLANLLGPVIRKNINL